MAIVAALLGGCGNGGAGDDAGAVGTTSLAVETEACGNGTLDLYRAPPPACPNPSVVTEVFDRVALNAWLANPTTTLDLKDSIAFSNEPLEISTACDVIVRSGVVLTGLTDVFIAARRVDSYADVTATGRVDVRAAESVYLRTASSVTGPAVAIALEAPYVDDYADSSVTGLYCVEATGEVYVRQASKNGSAGGAVNVTGSMVDVHGDFTSPGTVRMVSTGDLYLREAARLTSAGDVTLSAGGDLDVHGDLLGAGHVTFGAGGDLFYRQAARIENATSVGMTSGGFLDFHGTLYAAGPVALQADSFFYRDAALIETSGDVAVTVTGTTLTDFYGTMRSNGNIALSADSLYLRQAALTKSDRDVTLDVAGRLDMRGKIQQNEDVRVLTGTYKLYGTHSFAGNVSCIIAGSKTSDSVAAIGCSESPDASAPTWPAGSSLTASGIGPTSLTLSWTAATDTVGVVAYRIFQDGALIGDTSAGTRTLAVAGLASGTTYSFKVEAGDAAGRWSRTGPSTSATTSGGDSDGPVLTIETPTEGEVVTLSPVLVGGTVTDASGVAGVTINGEPAGVRDGIFKGSVSPTPGTNVVVVVATDVLGNSTTATVTFTYAPDETAPVVTITEPADGATVVEPWVLVRGTASDDTGVTTVLVNGMYVGVAGDEFSAWVNLVPGPNTIYVIAYDAAGNSGSASVSVTYEADVEGPALAITSPTDGATVYTSWVTVTGTVSDPSGVSSVLVNGAWASVIGDQFDVVVGLAPGANDLITVASDVWSNVSTASVHVVYYLDSSAPTVVIEQPADGAMLSESPVLVAGTVSDDLGVVAAFVNGVEVPLVGGRFEMLLDLPVGGNWITVTAADAAGNWGWSQVYVFYMPETEGPMIIVTLPAEGAVLHESPVVVTGTVTDSSGVAGVWVNGVPVPLVGNTFETTVEPVVGGNWVTVSAVDVYGNGSYVPVWYVYTTDVTPPTIVVEQPVDGTTVYTSTVTVAGTVSDESAVASVAVNGVPVGLSGSRFALDVALTPGSNAILVAASDVWGNSASASVTVEYVVDATPPSIVIEQPTSGETVYATPVLVSGQVSDTSGVSAVYVNGVLVTLAGGEFSASVEVPSGPSWITVQAVDGAGNWGSSSALVTYALEADPPVLTILSPTDGETVYWSFVTVSGTVTDASGVASVYANGGWTPVTGDHFDGFVELVPGLNTIVVTATDVWGNHSTASVTVTFQADTTPPTIVIEQPTDGAVVTEPSVLVTGQVWDDSVIEVVRVNGVEVPLVGGRFETTVSLVPGYNGIYAEVTDPVGNYASTSVTVRYVTDTDSPLLTVTSPTEGEVVFSPVLYVVGTASDASGVPQVLVNGGIVTWTGPDQFEGLVFLVPGSNIITVTATDSWGNVSLRTVHVVLVEDTPPPSIVIEQPIAEATVGESAVLVAGTVTDDHAVETVYVRGLPASVVADRFEATVDLTPGMNWIEVVAVDEAGNVAFSGVAVYYDAAGPSVIVAHPSHGATERYSPVAVSGTVTDHTGIAGVLVSGISASVAAGAFSASIALAPGANTIEVVATDIFGHATTVAVGVTYVPDASPPGVVITQPLSGQTLYATPITVRGTASDDSAVTEVRVNGNLASLAGGVFQGPAALVEGSNHIEVTAVDVSGNVGLAAVDVTYVADSTGPSVVVTSPADGSTVWRRTANVVGTATDASGVADVRVNGARLMVFDGSFATTVTLADGANEITVAATDYAGNTTVVPVHVTCIVDTAAPTIVIEQPARNEFIRLAPVLVAGTVWDADGIASVTVNGLPVIPEAGRFETTVSPSVGWNVATVQAADPAGNSSVAQVMYFYQPDTTSPAIYVDVPTDGQTVRFSPVTVSGRVEDDDAVAEVRVNDVPVPVTAGRFSSTVELVVGDNAITVAAVDPTGNRAERTVHVVYAPDFAGPVIVIQYPLESDVVFETPVDVIGTVTDASTIVGVFVDGLEAELVGGEFYGSADLVPGENTVVVSAVDDLDNRSEVSVTVVLEEWAPPEGPADGWIHGEVYDDPTGAPLVRARISSDEIGRAVVSDSHGKFVYPVPPVDEPAPGPLESDGTRPVRLRITADGYLEAVRVVNVPQHPMWFETTVEPAYLMRRDPAATPIGPEGGIAWNSLGTVALEVPPGALDHTVEVRLTEHQSGRSLPMPLPGTSQFTYAVKFEPDGTEFAAPARVWVANDLGFAPGTSIPVGWFDGEDWGHVGTSVVSDDGQWVVWDGVNHFCTADLNTSSFDEPEPDASSGGTDDGGGGDGGDGAPSPGGCTHPPCDRRDGGDDDEDEDECEEEEGSTISRDGGRVRESIRVGPSGRENDGGLSPWPLRLTYSSGTVVPHALIDHAVAGPCVYGPTRTANPYVLGIQGRRINIEYEANLLTACRFDDVHDARLRHLFDGRATNGDILPTGLYGFHTRIASRYTGVNYGTTPCFGCAAVADLGVPTREPVESAWEDDDHVWIRNDVRSAFGAGWALAGLKHLARGGDARSWAVYGGGGRLDLFDGVRAGEVLTVAGNGRRVQMQDGAPATQATLYSPTAIALDGDGALFVLHQRYGSDHPIITRVDPMTERAWVMLDGTWVPPLLGRAMDLGWSAETGLLVLTDRGVQDIHCVPDAGSASGISCSFDSTSIALLDHGDRMSVTPSGHIYVARQSRNDVWKINFTTGEAGLVAGTGVAGFLGDGGPAVSAMLNLIADVAADDAGNIYIADSGNLRIRHVDPDGVIETVAGNGLNLWSEDGLSARVSPIWPPTAVAIGPGGRLRFAVPYSVREVGPAGELVTLVGGYRQVTYGGEGLPGRRAGVGTVRKMLHSPLGDLWYADTGNPTSYAGGSVVNANRVRRLLREDAPHALLPLPRTVSQLVDVGDGTMYLENRDGTRYLFDRSGRHVQTVARDGSAVSYEYDPAGRVSAVIDAVGRAATFVYDSAGKLDRITDFSEATTEFTVDAAGDLVAVQPPGYATPARTFAYDSQHLLSSQTNGRKVSAYTYGEWGMAASVTHGDAPPRTIVPADSRFLNNGDEGRTGVQFIGVDNVAGFPFAAMVTDERGVTREYAYGAPGVITGWRRWTGDPYATIYDLVEEMDPNGLKTRYYRGVFQGPFERLYDATGRLLWSRSGYIGTTEFTWEYDPECGTPVVRNRWDVWGSVTATETWTWDESCRLTSRTDETGVTTTYEYDVLTGLLAEEVDPLGWRVRYQYDEYGRRVYEERRDGTVTTVEYDSSDRVVRETRTASGGLFQETQRTYDDEGRLRFVYGPALGYTEYRYDESSPGCGGGCCSCRSPGPTTVIDPDGNVTQYVYDAEGRTIQVTDPTGAVTSRDYDDAGLLASTSDDAGRRTFYEYDWNQRLSSATDAASGTTAYTYSSFRSDNAVENVTDAEGRVSYYRWGTDGDTYGSVTHTNLPDSGWDEYHYTYGRLRQQSRAAAVHSRYDRDASGRVTRISFGASSGRRQFRVEYEREAALGRISTVREAQAPAGTDSWVETGRTEFLYDDEGRVLSEARTQDGIEYATGHAYDGFGNVVEMTYPSGLVVRYDRDPTSPSRLAAVVAIDGGVGTVLAEDLTYSDAGLLLGYTMGNGLRYEMERGAGGLVERITTGLPGDPTPDILDLTYAYDGVGNITDILDAVDVDRTAHYDYDNLDRLVGADGWWGRLDWTYDHTGNRLSESRLDPGATDAAVSNYAYHGGTSRLLTVTGAATGATEHALEYDASGNATRYDDVLLEYDSADRVIAFRDRATGELVEENTYDHAFRRTKRVEYLDQDGDTVLETSTCTAFAYDRKERLSAEYNCLTGAPLAEYVYLNRFHCLAVRREGAWNLHINDHLSTPRKLTGATGYLEWDGSMEPWGTTREWVATVSQSARFPGQIEDVRGLPFYNHYRYYLPDLGRFASADLLLMGCSLSGPAILPYAYANDRPVLLTDDSGLKVVGWEGCPDGWDSRFERVARRARCMDIYDQPDNALDVYNLFEDDEPVITVRCTNEVLRDDDPDEDCRCGGYNGACGAGRNEILISNIESCRNCQRLTAIHELIHAAGEPDEFATAYAADSWIGLLGIPSGCRVFPGRLP
ncbi:MAG: hypothetical protein HY905_28200 [Deltaproteobacteria bacterium]|nr:hypothetical protein [Deltaproteobacteria bacterium]